MRVLLIAIVLCTSVLSAACARNDALPPRPVDAAAAPTTLQEAVPSPPDTAATPPPSKAPVDALALYLDDFHPAKSDPAQQVESHHYCDEVTETLTQCVLFESNTANSRLIGVEYIIAASLYDTLPSEERAYWHPHNYEILSGQLRLPGLSPAAEEAALKRLMNSYGKTWQTWTAGMWGRSPDSVPLGPARLQWSFNRDGEASPGMILQRDRRMGFNAIDARRKRQSLAPLARPQGGVDAMAGLFGARAMPLPGVSDSGDPNTSTVPVISMREP